MMGLRVLFLETDSLTSEVRIRPLLEHLQRAGRIAGYARVDRDMALSGDAFDRYDVALTHRIPSTRQIAWLKRTCPPFLYDIDDLLLRLPDRPNRRRQAREQETMTWCLLNAERITAPSPRLLLLLEQRLGVTFGRRQVFLPNAGLETPALLKTRARPAVLWVSSAVHAWTEELDAVCRGAEQAVRELDIEIVLLGRFPRAVFAAFRRSNRIAWLPHADYLQYLADHSFIALAPLSTGLPLEDQLFIDCKSDIKAAEYGSSRIAAAFSPAVPYQESDLPCRLVPDNGADCWHEAIVGLAKEYPEAGNRIAEHAAFATRRPSVLALRLLQSLDDCRSLASAPFGFRAIPAPRLGRILERRVRAIRSRLFPRPG